jgi:outer membrane protein assembly factor BamA
MISTPCSRFLGSVLVLSLGLSLSPATRAAAQEVEPADDGWPDISGFLDQKYGFLPIAVPITEPAIGYGAAFGAAFLSKPLGAEKAGLGRPNITFAGGMVTENGTWGAFASDTRYWLDDRLQTLANVIYADMNLDYYGTGKNSALENEPLRYALNPVGLGLQAKYRFGDTRIWAGLGYSFAYTTVSFDATENTAELPHYDSSSRVGGVTLLASYDSRDNLFTPLRGSFLELSFGFFNNAFGGQDNFERGSLTAMQYFALSFNLFLGLRGDVGVTFRDAPFYLMPYIQLRGVPVLRRQGEEVAQAEAELRWQFWGRLSLLAFIGAGGAWNNFEKLDNSTGVIAGGPGIRYEIARSYGIHMGIDVGFSKDATAFYVQVGSAWMKP